MKFHTPGKKTVILTNFNVSRQGIEIQMSLIIYVYIQH